MIFEKFLRTSSATMPPAKSMNIRKNGFVAEFLIHDC